MVGDSGPVAISYLQHFLQKIKTGETLKLFTNEFRSVLGGESAARGLFLVLEKLSGIYHLGGLEKLSRYDLGMAICKAFNIMEANIITCKQEDVSMAANRPPDVSLNIQKAKLVGYTPKKLENELLTIP